MKGGGVMDSAIKLFGRRIPLPVYSHLPASSGFDAASLIPDPSEYMEAEGGSEIVLVEAENPSVANSDQNAHHVTPKEEKQQQGFSETSSSGEGDQGTKLQPKKPNKILACPRCSSTDTKFCYFNNYNVNQPRHFCKHCQRYWTAGGTMRNVPIGAGRRKNKQLASTQYHQIILSAADALCPTSTATTTTTTNTVNNNLGNGITVLKFGTQSTATVLNVSDQNCYGANCRGNYPIHCSYPIPMAMNTNFDVAVPRRNVAAAEAQHSSGLVYPQNCGNGPGPYQLCSPQMLGVPGFGAPSIPVQFIPVPAVAPHWGCMPVWAGGAVENATAMNGFSSPHVSGSTSNGFQILGPYTRNSTSVFHEKRVDQSVLGSSEMTRVNGSSDQAGSTSYICSAEVRGRPR